ncbi:MAG: hypothetical protein GY809_00210, partial [Planctomycetes bacterium]|nr:hypothetical protein [Planctomycetota bacterium]
EIGELADSFERMSRELRHTLDDLQTEVQTRQDAQTKLASSNGELTQMVEELERVNQELKSLRMWHPVI